MLKLIILCILAAVATVHSHSIFFPGGSSHAHSGAKASSYNGFGNSEANANANSNSLGFGGGSSSQASADAAANARGNPFLGSYGGQNQFRPGYQPQPLYPNFNNGQSSSIAGSSNGDGVASAVSGSQLTGNGASSAAAGAGVRFINGVPVASASPAAASASADRPGTVNAGPTGTSFHPAGQVPSVPVNPGPIGPVYAGQVGPIQSQRPGKFVYPHYQGHPMPGAAGAIRPIGWDLGGIDVRAKASADAIVFRD